MQIYSRFRYCQKNKKDTREDTALVNKQIKKPKKLQLFEIHNNGLMVTQNKEWHCVHCAVCEMTSIMHEITEQTSHCIK